MVVVALTGLLVPSSCVGRRGETLTFNATEDLNLSEFEVGMCYVICLCYGQEG